MKKNSGISIVTLTITIIVILILASLALSSSTDMIDQSIGTSKSGESFVDDEEIRALATFVKAGIEEKVGIPLANGVIEVVVKSGDTTNVYGSGLYLIPGGDDKTIDLIKEKTGYKNVEKYKNLTASYVVDYSTQDFVRVKELIFK